MACEVDLKRFLLGLCCLPWFCYAAAPEGYVDTGQWHVAVALGFGQKSNPLIGGDDLPLLVLPEVAYYGERFYFDNGDVGYTLVDSERFSVSVLTRFNVERAYFSFVHPSNILLTQSVSQAINSGELCVDCSGSESDAFEVHLPSLDELSSRKYAIDGGLSFNVHLSAGGMVRAQWMQDISGVYRGQNALLEYSSGMAFGESRLGFTVGARYKSQKLMDYYYGIGPQDSVDPLFYYQAKASWQPYVKLTYSRPINEHWSLLTLLRYSYLGSGMSDSPVVKDNSTSTFFVGASYGF